MLNHIRKLKYHDILTKATILDISNFSENDLESYCYHYLYYNAEFTNVDTIIAFI